MRVTVMEWAWGCKELEKRRKIDAEHIGVEYGARCWSLFVRW